MAAKMRVSCPSCAEAHQRMRLLLLSLLLVFSSAAAAAFAFLSLLYLLLSFLSFFVEVFSIDCTRKLSLSHFSLKDTPIL